MEENGYEAALEQIASLLQRPDQLEKLPELRKRADRKMDISSIETGIAAIRHRLTPFPQLREKMKELRDANARHGQYAAAMENLKHIFNISRSIQETKTALDQGKLLVAHKNIMDLELARDELLFEVHKSNSPNKDYEKNLLVTFFIKVDELVTDLSSNMWFIIGRALEMVKGSESGSGPQELVSCIRIVEREERIDSYYVEKKAKGSEFMPPGRPRQWRKKTFEVLEKTVWSRVEGNQLEDRSLNKAWLARKVIVDDLQIARAAVPCFPPDYQIYDRFVHMYHNCVCKRLREIAAEQMEKSELVHGEELLGNRRLQINAAALLDDVPVLSRSTLNTLYDSFIEMTRTDMKNWLDKTLSAEKDDWNKHVRPDEDNFGYFYTSLPNIMFGMLRDTVTLAKEVSVEVIPSVINLTIEEFFVFANKYKDAFTAYRNKYFENRSNFREFTSTMVAIANNLQTVNYLLEEICEDLSPHLAELFSRKWLVGCSATETICMTVQDYYADHRHLRPATRCALLMDLQFRIVGEYLKAIDSRRLTFTSYEERASAGSRMKSDSQRLEAMFQQLLDCGDINEPFSLVCSLISNCGEVISLRDKSLLTLEVTTFSRKYPNIPVELLSALLASRDDVSRSEARLVNVYFICYSL
ncbi:unnamed protein product [Nippostrongylus brasiliensis]|uniref:Exocyst complex component 3 (inferred by orthology to a C. elegans protein) n=1 Tax=Nippostrongylus brasiliensis TaxID=27835 RepID=A0A0N4XUI0_NIPBR|nr:unnamed protein product [Nippostrongylus brasiliensis]